MSTGELEFLEKIEKRSENSRKSWEMFFERKTRIIKDSRRSREVLRKAFFGAFLLQKQSIF